MERSLLRSITPSLHLSIVFLVLLGFYIYGASPSISTGDSAELATAAVSLGIAHSPGYPLYVLAGKMFTGLLPWGHPAYVMNLFSGFSTALAFGILAWVFKGSFLTYLILISAGLGPLFVEQATGTEVFGPHLLIVSILIAVVFPLLRMSETKPEGPSRDQRPTWLLACFLFGLGLANQQTLLLLSPAFLLLVLNRPLWTRIWGNASFLNVQSIHWISWSAFFVFLGLTIYLTLYLRSRVNPLLDWEDPETLTRFWKVVSRARYGTLQLTQGKSASLTIAAVGAHIQFFGSSLYTNFGAGGLALLGVGLCRGWRKGKSLPNLFFLTAILFSGPFFLMWANLMPTEGTSPILERFILMPLFLTLIFPLRGVDLLWGRPEKWVKALALLTVILWGQRAYAQSLSSVPHDRWNLLTRDFGVNILRHLPLSAYLFSDRADETEFSLAYLQMVEHRRNDMTFIDANAGVTKSIYGQDYYEIWGKPRLARRQLVEERILRETSRPVFYATLDLSQLRIPRQQAGFLYEAHPNGKFSARTRFPYWAVQLWERQSEDPRGREKHLLFASGRLMGDYALSLNELEVAQRFYFMADQAGSLPWPMNLAVWHQQKGHLALAESLYLKVLKRSGSHPTAWNNLGILYADQGDFGKALDCYKRAAQADPANSEAHYNAGVIFWRKKDWPNVVRAFEETLQRDPGHEKAKQYLAEAQRRIK